MMEEFGAGFSEFERPGRSIDHSKVTPEMLERLPTADESDIEYMNNFTRSIIIAVEIDDQSEIHHEESGFMKGIPPVGWISRLYKNAEYGPYIEKMFQNLKGRLDAPVVPFSDEKRDKMEERIENAFQLTLQPAPVELDKDFFKTTNHTRNFIGTFGRGISVENRPITHTLFGIPSFQIGQPHVNLEEAAKYIKENINGKNILLLGGGNSVEDLLYNTKEFQPQMIVNADPHELEAEEDLPGKNSYKRIEIRAEDPGLPQKLKEIGVEQFDEIWATYSVPYYLDTGEAIENMFQNAKLLLAPGGTLRIHPFSLPTLVSRESFFKRDPNKELQLMNQNSERSEAYLEIVQQLNRDPELNVSIVNTDGGINYSTLIIQKCSK